MSSERIIENRQVIEKKGKNLDLEIGNIVNLVQIGSFRPAGSAQRTRNAPREGQARNIYLHKVKEMSNNIQN